MTTFIKVMDEPRHDNAHSGAKEATEDQTPLTWRGLLTLRSDKPMSGIRTATVWIPPLPLKEARFAILRRLQELTKEMDAGRELHGSFTSNQDRYQSAFRLQLRIGLTAGDVQNATVPSGILA